MDAFCPACRAPTLPNASFCARCGASLLPAPAPARPSGTAESLILAGAIVALVMIVPAALAALFFAFFFGGAMAMFFSLFGLPVEAWIGPGALAGIVSTAAIVALSLGIVWAVLAFRARAMIREGNVDGGSTLAIVLGAVLVVLGIGSVLPAIPGGLVLAGGLLARSGRRAGGAAARFP